VQILERAEAGDRLARTSPQVAPDHLVQVGEPDPASTQLETIPILGEIWVASEDVGRLLDRLMERKIFERVQRIVVNEYRDRSLSRKQV
jgi:hypothetical protein